ncbi:flavin monoamine oxidase family protein [Hansschlegelia quercus]|uniref:Tryptophan 2-monooxygenase n=1 Tax=Hansschlegelia quercus TaxID=2528245 RepID=A0A4Q9GGW2_9HYPH|nr:NAD(P)/FAD-dependent oxidoreductase [Hansschlegelia quercus]TBN52601.1 FAD-dependent oxidoreductase [Hansschlegelia quercus]
MTRSSVEVVVVGGGAAGIGAARKLHEAGIDVLIVEARDRLGGRAYTVQNQAGGPFDLGCGWLHSGDVNPWTAIAEAQGRAIDRSPPPWTRRTLEPGFSRAEQDEFERARDAYGDRIEALARTGVDSPASAELEPGNRWNGLLDAVSTWYSGAELEKVSVVDLANYEDTGVNWRVVGGYGAAIAAHGAGLKTALGAAVTRIDHSGPKIRIETSSGVIEADQAIVTLPSALIAEGALAFSPALPGKVEAAAGLPLGLADKLYIALDRAEEFEIDGRILGRTDRTATAGYHMRPGGEPVIEGYFGGTLAEALEAGGEAAFFDFASRELSGVFGADFAKRLRPLAHHAWRGDPFARGSYSYAKPGCAGARAVLAAPVDDRLFFAGEACSKSDFSTAHGALRTGLAAAEAVIAVRRSGKTQSPK